MTLSPFLIRPDELSDRLGQRDLRVVDASWYLPAMNRDAKAEFEAGHVPGAVFFDQDASVDPASDLPHTLPSNEGFSRFAGALGLSVDDAIVVYDGAGLFSAPRVWWMLRSFGARDVRVLHGGLPAWTAAGLPVESGPARPVAATFAARLDEGAVVPFEEMRRLVDEGSAQIADARSAERFAGTAPEPRAGVRGGHMPGAHSLPIGALIAEGKLKDPQELDRAFRAAGIDPAAPVVTSCGSGVTAAVINFALATMDRDAGRLFDGSWTQWGSAPDTPVETGPGTRS